MLTKKGWDETICLAISLIYKQTLNCSERVIPVAAGQGVDSNDGTWYSWLPENDCKAVNSCRKGIVRKRKGEKMMKKKKRNVVMMWIAAAVMVIGMMLTSLVKHDFGKVSVSVLKWKTADGLTINCDLYVPDTATAENPAPAIVTLHGKFANLINQEIFAMEYARRGFVVLNYDAPDHGDSESAEPGYGPYMTSLYEAVQQVASLNYVDSERIGFEGHSLAGYAANTALDLENLQGGARLSSFVYTSCEPVIQSMDLVTDDNPNGYYNAYTNGEDVAIIADQYDEFFFTTTKEDGTTTAARDYLSTDNAKSFLNFGSADTSGTYEANTIYTNPEDGAKRVIYNPVSFHCLTLYTPAVIRDALDFMDDTLDAPNPISGSNQIWGLEMLFSTIGLVGFALFVVYFILTMTDGAYFAEVKAADVSSAAYPRVAGKKEKRWMILGIIISMAFSMLIIFPLYHVLNPPESSLTQNNKLLIALWSILGAAVSFALMLPSIVRSKKQGDHFLEEQGIVMTKKRVGKTVLLALITVAAAYLFVYIGRAVFDIDVRFYDLKVSPLTKARFLDSFRYVAFFVVFYIIYSLSGNCFNYVSISGKEKEKPWINLLVITLCNIIPILLLIAINVIGAFITGFPTYGNSDSNAVVQFLTMWIVLGGASVMGRKVYRETKNPYVFGIAFGVIATFICVTGTSWLLK